MKKRITSTLVAIFTITLLNAQEVYEVVKAKQPVNIDADWDKKQWKKVKPVTVTNYIREETDNPIFKPKVQSKMVYDKDNIYVIFRVEDKYVRCITDKINGPVWKDSAVEFFFAPDTEKPLHYFNLETNCGGTALMQFHVNVDGKRKSKRLAEEEIRQIEIAHSLPSIIDTEITENVTWTIEYRIPIALLQKHSPVTVPAKGVEWKANFYKIAEINSNPHHIAWSKIDHPRPNFHMPEVFGKLIFK